MRPEVVRFLIAGGSAAAINWLSRIALSWVLPYWASMLVAYGIGMAAGFWLYRTFVFRGATGRLPRQAAVFVAVNAAGAGVVLGVSTLLIAALTAVLPALPLPVAEALGHGVGIAAGAVSNYFGHQILTFGVRRGGHAPAGAHTL
ncbi:sugar translocase [Methylobacterium variabile]|jgi:putative flippase GtrA|uniref:Sugar translocase n=1 Tax=Methylobacterium variabile TaxID=298794 RepID=A0A0J6T9L3_9HYPH|nr:GtrA family protein [Methylobacterium variabile]KMO42582.1 sugar translocase [Methylobacterium variabile]